MQNEAPPVNRSTKVAPLITRRKVAMLEAGLTGLEIALDLGITKQAVSAVINGRKSTPRVQQAIADRCGLPLEELFPPELQPDESTSVAA
jgi:transcriptional regulator with XRE-family HTH domain